MKIHDIDISLLEAFLYREIEDYNWLPDDERESRGRKDWPTKKMRQKVFFNRMKESIIKQLSLITSGANYIKVQSLSNMGLVERELTLTPWPWDHENIVLILLPPCVNGGVNVCVQAKEKESRNVDSRC